jgi:U3 small nucleolar RNA-associated protein 10
MLTSLQTISRVVPPLVMSLRRKNQNFVLGISELLLSFVAAYEHIPLHRRLGLFSQLLKTLGPDGSLAATSALLFDRYPTDMNLASFVKQLMKQFDAATTLKSYNQYLDLVEDGLKPRRQLSNAFFGLKDKNVAEIEQALVTLLEGLIAMLEDEQLKGKLDRIFMEEKSEVSMIRQHFLLLVERIIITSNQVKSQVDCMSDSYTSRAFDSPEFSASSLSSTSFGEFGSFAHR